VTGGRNKWPAGVAPRGKIAHKGNLIEVRLFDEREKLPSLFSNLFWEYPSSP